MDSHAEKLFAHSPAARKLHDMHKTEKRKAERRAWKENRDKNARQG